MKLWKITCMEGEFPGMWLRWYKNQCVGVGWCAKWGTKLEGGKRSYGWSRACNAIKAVQVGDWIVVALHGNRVGRIGQVTGKAIEDTDWNPLVPPSRSNEDGEIGRRIFVRWDLNTGPDDRDQVVMLPPEARFSSGELRPTMSQIPFRKLSRILKAMNDPSNWIGLDTHFDYESALQGYIAAYPHHLEDGLLPHPDKKVREKVFKDGTRSDVLLIDRGEHPVIVECKQGTALIRDVEQLRHYMKHLARESIRKPRGILVHGGALKLSESVRKCAAKNPKVEIVRYALNVDFERCS